MTRFRYMEVYETFLQPSEGVDAESEYEEDATSEKDELMSEDEAEGPKVCPTCCVNELIVNTF